MAYIILVSYILVINIISFFVMGYDKRLAIKNKRRISEKTLFLFTLFLGGIGIYTGMFKFRHKTKHMKFLVFVPITIIINCFSVYYIISYVFEFFKLV